MTLREWLRNKVLRINKIAHNDNLEEEDERLTFINDKQMILKHRVREYNIWYMGEGDELLNFYTHQNTIEYHYEPFYSRNKKHYFWAISSTEGDIKRTHSGQPRNIVDTLVSVMGVPDVRAGHGELKENNVINENLQKMLDENDFFNSIYKQEQVPMTMVEGWGAFKVVWDKDISDFPIPVYYRAENVEFVYKLNRIIGIIFKDYYTDGKKNYLVTETRRRSGKHLICEKELFEVLGTDENATLKKMEFSEVDLFAEVEPKIIIENFPYLMAQPCVFIKDPSGDAPGRSLYSGKVDLFDDLDMALSQDGAAIRKSTPIEYFDSSFLERDRNTGMPIQPKAFDRKYIMVKGAKNADGSPLNNQPVTVTQPNINFAAYSQEAQSILLNIMNGLISPATMGIDIAKKDNADAQREKEKVTIFTRNNFTASETTILKGLFNQCLCAKELMDTNEITVFDYDISITFPEFADDSFENKITILGDQLDKGNLSYKMYLSKLYGGKLSDSEYQEELDFLKEQHEGQNQPEGFEDMFPPQSTGPQGTDGGNDAEGMM